MKEVHMNEGEYIEYTNTKKAITFDDDLTINLQKREQDEDVLIDICADSDGFLTTGVTEDAKRYVAQVKIPAREYTFDEEENPAYNPDEEEGPQNQKTITKKNPVPFDIEKCTVYLFALA